MNEEEKVVLVTRVAAQARSLADALQAGGVRPVCVPTIEIIEPESWQEVDACVAQIDSYDTVIFTSVNAVSRFVGRMPDDKTLGEVISIGEKTSAALRRHNVEPTLTATDSNAEGVLELLGDVRGKKYLLPRARFAREILPDTVRARGGHIDVAVVYEIVTAFGSEAELKNRLSEGVHAITFLSPSALRGFLELTGPPPESVQVAAIGGVTAETAAEHGVRVDVVPETPSVEALAAALVDSLLNSGA